MSDEIGNDNKVVIESLSDFLKIPYSKLKSTKLSNFNGKFFEELYQNALKIESGEIKQIPKQISKIDTPESSDFINGDINNDNMKMMHNPLYHNNNNNNNKIIIQKDSNNNNDYETLKPNPNRNNEMNINYNNNNNININNYNKIYNNNVRVNNNNMNINRNINNNNNMNLNNNNMEMKRNMNNKKDINKNNNNMNINNNNRNMTNNQSLNLQKVSFEIEYSTVFGEEIGICGSGNSLGNWDPNKVFKLKWTNGNIWRGSITLNQYNFINFEFKFVLLSNNKIKTWESGGNNIVNFNNIYQQVLRNRKGKFSKYNYEYINDELILKCKWT